MWLEMLVALDVTLSGIPALEAHKIPPEDWSGAGPANENFNLDESKT
jgi:hypothetical protein